MNGSSPAGGSVPLHLLSALRPLAASRVVRVWRRDPEECSSVFPEAAAVVAATSHDPTPNTLLLCAQLDDASDFLFSADLQSALASGAQVALWTRTRPPTLPAAPFLAHYVQRNFAGTLLREAQFERSQVAVLRGKPNRSGSDLHLWLLSAEPLPALPSGLYEATAEPRLLPLPDPDPSRSPSDDRAAVGLAGRLLEVENRTMQLRATILKLKAEVASGGGGHSGGGSFDVPRTKHSWPLAEVATLPNTASLYDRRPDDAVLTEARTGEAFMTAYRLLGETPDFAAAVAALNAVQRIIQLEPDYPDVSIIIPVYGQLPYTLNCLDSLFQHATRFSVEIIVLDDCSPDRVTAEFISQVHGVRYHRQAKNGGFIRSCNTGGDIARGAYVLLLNSDTRVVAGWLDEMISSFALFPRAGLVGSKMFYPDGTLQEAGGILWRDGSAWNYGRDDDPNRPQYCFARQVDYISGCSIVLPTLLWRELGGFDPYYTPAYAEDADLCQRVSARGLEVWFQPASRIVHYEGKTSGTSTGSGVKGYQVINLRKLFLRWRSQFESHRRNAENPFLEKERSVRKRILFVDAVTPTPDQDAGSVQTALGLRCAQRAGYKACFVPEDNWLFVPVYTPLLQREGVECAYAPFDVGFDNYIRRYGWMFDAVIIYRVHVMEKCLPLMREYAPGALTLFHVADLHYLRLQRQAALEEDADLAQLAAALKEKELETVRQSDCTITHSTIEAEILTAELPNEPVTVWPLMMETVGTTVGFAARRDLCFLGGYRHPPNVDAVVWFVQDVFPLIQRVRPEIRFIIAGANPTPEVQALASDAVTVTGMVANLPDVFDAARVFVCPLRVGAGAKGKVMSAMAHGLPIVSTPIGVEGAGLVEGEHVLVAENSAALAAEVLRLYDDSELWSRLSLAGIRLVESEFSIGMGVSRLEDAIEKGHRKRLGLLNA